MSGAMLIDVSMPFEKERWSLLVFGVLGDDTTCYFHSPLCSQRSGRLFLRDVLVACDQTLTDHETGIAVGVPLHSARWTQNQRRTRGIPFCWLSCLIANDQGMAARTLATRISWIDAARDDPFIPCLVLGILEDASLHPEGAFALAATTILALLCFERALMLKDKNGRLMRFGKWDNASTHLMGEVLVGIADRAPERDVLLLALGNDPSLLAVTCNASQLVRAFSRLSLDHHQ